MRVPKIGEAMRGFGFKQWFLLLLNVVMLLAAAAALLGLRFVSGALTLDAADRFRGESELRFAQLACFFPVDRGKSADDIRAFRETVAARLTEQSLEAPENGSLTIDAYSGSATLSLQSEYGSAQATAVGVGGDFFYFHPLTLRSGNYIDEGDLMDDLVVLDEEMAWRLFGGTELTGMSLTIQGEPFLVAGVVSRAEDFASQRAYGEDSAGIFLSYSALKRLKEDATISCYEIVMPDPITNFAMGVLRDGLAGEKGDAVENSSRYSLGHLLEVMGDFGERSMRLGGVIYPYWENAARLTEDYAALLMLLAVLCALCPVTFAVVIGVRFIHRSYRRARTAIPARIEAAVERRREERLEREYEKRAKGEETDHGRPASEEGKEDL